MRTHKVLAAGVAVLALGIVSLAGGRAADDDAKKAREEVDKLAGIAASKPDELQKAAEAYAKNLDSLEDVMNLMKKRAKDGKGGVGVGPKPTGELNDGIEIRIQNMGKGRGPTAAALKKEGDDLKQMVNRVKAIAAIALAKTPTKKEGDKDPKDWKEYSQDMKKGADELGKAIEAGDSAAAKKAATNLNASCTACHGKFRD